MDFRLDVGELAGLITDRTKLIILNSPQNPTGGVLTEQDIDGHCRRDRRSQHHGVDRRNLLPPDLRRRASLDRVGRRIQGAHHYSRRFLQDLRHDRLAHGLRRHARRPGDTRLAADDELQLMHRQLHPGRGHRGHSRRPGIRRRDEMRRVQEAARSSSTSASTRSRDSRAASPRARSTCSPTSSRPDGHRRSWPTRCWTRPASPALSGTAFGDFGEGYLRFSVANSIENIEKALDRVGSSGQRRYL